MRHEVRFERGHNCIDFQCVNGSPDCAPGRGGSHGICGMQIRFLVHGDKGTIQFVLSTGWVPHFKGADQIGSRMGLLEGRGWGKPMPTDLGYHSYEPHYEGQETGGPCEFLGGKPCYYDGSGLNAYDAFYVLVNCGEDALWTFLEGVYKSTFDGAEYPEVPEYEKPRR